MTSYHKYRWVKPTKIYYLKVSVGQKCRRGSGSHLSEIKVSAGAEVSPKAGASSKIYWLLRELSYFSRGSEALSSRSCPLLLAT